MTDRITIEDRLIIFAQGGLTQGFTLRIWDSKAKSLKNQGIILRNPRPTIRKGEKQYEIDFSTPLPGTFSEVLYKTAMNNRIEDDNGDIKPLQPPYSSQD